MPTKLGKGGHGEQNYVPSGNGDASGEYGDNATGSNIHFTNFKKPDDKTTTKETDDIGSRFGIGGGTEENRKKKLKDRLQFDENVEKTLAREYKRYLEWGLSKEDIKQRLTKYLIDGRYGSIVRPRDEWQSKYEDFYGSMSEWMEENKPQKYYYKKGNKWVETYDKWDYGNRKYYTESEYQEKVAQEQVKNLKQSKYDIEINKIFGENCAVSFGKNYSDEYMEKVVEASKTVVNDFPNMNGFIRAIGDRNSLEKLTQARARENLTEENITKIANEIIEKQKNMFGRDISLEDAREKAKKQILDGGLSLSRSGSRTLAYWSPSQRALVMLPKTAKDNADANQVSYYNQNWHSSDKPMATYFHEFGHAIDSMVSNLYGEKIKNNDYNTSIKLRTLNQEFNDEMREFARQNYNAQYESEYVKRYNKIAGTNYGSKQELDRALNRSYSRDAYNTTNEVKESLKKDGIKKYSISEYGATNGQEFIAECFSAYYTGMDNELANKVVERFKKFYNDVRSF